MLSRSASAAYLSAGTAPRSALAPPPEELAWAEPYVAKSALQDFGKLSKLAKLALASPGVPPAGEEDTVKHGTGTRWCEGERTSNSSFLRRVRENPNTGHLHFYKHTSRHTYNSSSARKKKKRQVVTTFTEVLHKNLNNSQNNEPTKQTHTALCTSLRHMIIRTNFLIHIHLMNSVLWSQYKYILDFLMQWNLWSQMPPKTNKKPASSSLS